MPETLPKVFINSYPKAGTNLLQKLLEVAGFEYSKKSVALSSVCGRYAIIKRVLRSGLGGVKTVPIGLEMNASVSLAWLDRYLRNVEPGEYVTGHSCFSEAFSSLLDKYDFKVLQIHRDPFDLALSTAKYVVEDHNHWYPLFKHMKSLSEEQRVELFFRGDFIRSLGVYYEPYHSVMRKLDGWASKSNACDVTFENLVNSISSSEWRLEINRIMTFLNVSEEKCIDEVTFQSKVFGKSHTFRSGQVGIGRGIYFDRFKGFVK